MEAVSIPVCANGDIQSTEDAKKAMRLSGAAGLLVGRGALGRPWFIGQVADVLAGRPERALPSIDLILDTMRTQLEHTLTLYGERGLRSLRKHLSAYCEVLDDSDILKSSLMKATTSQEAFRALDLYQRDYGKAA